MHERGLIADPYFFPTLCMTSFNDEPKSAPPQIDTEDAPATEPKAEPTTGDTPMDPK